MNAQTNADWQLVQPTEVPKHATFYWLSLERHGIPGPPAPFNPCSSCDVYSLGDGSFAVNDSGLADPTESLSRLVSFLKTMKEQSESNATASAEMSTLAESGLSSGGVDGPQGASDYGPNDLWLEILGTDAANAYLTLHGTVPSEPYQLLMQTNVAQPVREWSLGEIIAGFADTNQTPFQPVFIYGEPRMFFRAHHADALIGVGPGPNAIEPNAAIGDAGQTGIFWIGNGGTVGATVHYEMSGTAVEGVDYSNVSGTVSVPAGNTVEVDVSPIADGIPEGTESAILTVVPSDGYLIESSTASAVIAVKDSSETISAFPLVSGGIEPDGPPGAPAVTGEFFISRNDERSEYPPLVVNYSLGGTARNGIDYTSLSGTFTFGTFQTFTNIYVEPLADGVGEGVETVTLTLVPTNTYVVDPFHPSADVNISDSSTTVSIEAGLNAAEAGGGSSAQIGTFTLTRADDRGLYPALNVQYSISGSASNGVDYTNISSTVAFPANSNSATVYIDPLADGLLEGDETVTLRLVSGNGYLVDSNSSWASILIFDADATNLFVPVVTNFNQPVGIDYYAPSNSLLLSWNYSSFQGTGGEPYNFARIYLNGTNTAVTNWSGVHSVLDEVKLATVKSTVSGFTNGEIFFGSDIGIGWVAANGGASNLNWCILTNEVVTNALLLRGSLYVDQTGTFSNNVIAVTSPGSGAAGEKGVWRVDFQRHPTLVANIDTPHLEGVITLTNDPQKWGPWAGRIITGDEDKSPNPVIYTIDTNGVVTPYDTAILVAGGIHPEDFDIIQTNQNFYACDTDQNMIVELSGDILKNHVGDLLITDAGENVQPAAVFIVHWDNNTTNFVTTRFSYKRSDHSNGRFEHATFAPLKLPNP